MGIRLKPWQWAVLAAPVVAIVAFVLIAAGSQIHTWGLSWVWALFTLVLVGWRWLVVRWTQSGFSQIQSAIDDMTNELEATSEKAAADQALLASAGPEASDQATGQSPAQQAEAIIQAMLEETLGDRPLWEDWPTFLGRCQTVVTEVAHIYHPEVKYPLLNIYIPQAYALIRGTTDDVDQWMQKLTPALNQVTVGQVYEGYEIYRKLEPSARKLWKVWSYVQWAVNPVAAAARTASKGYGSRANQQLLVNLSQLLREVALRNLAQQAIALYSGDTLPMEAFAPSEPVPLPKAKTETLRVILDRAEPVAEVEQKPVNILLVGRTGAGKSSLINTLFRRDLAEVDVLPSTETLQSYEWKTAAGEQLNLWDTPGYEQVEREELRELVLDYAATADLLLLVTPAMDPALQMDVDFLRDMRGQAESLANLPAIAILTQVDRLRPVREWQPPYDWQWGEQAKEISIRKAIGYRSESLGGLCEQVIPVVTGELQSGRQPWNGDMLSMALVTAIDPAKQLRLARFLRNQEARTVAAAKIIDQYMFQMATTQGLTALLKSPVLQFVSTITTGNPVLAQVLAQQIPVEKLPVIIGKLQMAYDLFTLLKPEAGPLSFDLIKLWPFLLEDPVTSEDSAATVTQDAWAFGHALVEFWSQDDLSVTQLRSRFESYLERA